MDVPHKYKQLIAWQFPLGLVLALVWDYDKWQHTRKMANFIYVGHFIHKEKTMYTEMHLNKRKQMLKDTIIQCAIVEKNDN